jgi:hypothetical protein
MEEENNISAEFVSHNYRDELLSEHTMIVTE